MAHTSEGEHVLTQRATTLVSIVAASLLVILKLGVGLLTGSLGLISSGIESSGDVVAAALTFFAVGLGGRPADFDHPYGHRRAENLGRAGGGCAPAGRRRARQRGGDHPPVANGKAPHDPLVRVRGYRGGAPVLELSRMSVALRAARAATKARHCAPTRCTSPAISAGSLAVLAGLLAVRAGVRDGDSLAALLVAAIIFAAAMPADRGNTNALMDHVPAQTRTTAELAIAGLGEDIELDRLRLRESAGRYFADVVVSVPPGQAVVEGHRAADLVENALEQALPGSDVVVHVEPRRQGLDLRDRVLAIALSEPLSRRRTTSPSSSSGDPAASHCT